MARKAASSSVRRGWGEHGYLEDLAGEWAPEVTGDAGSAVGSSGTCAAVSPRRSFDSLRAAKELVRQRCPIPPFACRPLSSPTQLVPARPTTSLSGSEAPRSRSSRNSEVSTPGSMTMPTARRWRRRVVLSRASPDQPAPSACSPPFSSPTSSARPSWRLESATRPGGISSRRHHAIVRRELARFQGRELDTAGDGFFASFDGPARAVRAASAIRDALGPLEIKIRSGLHTGECEVTDGKVAGIAVSIGARISSLAGPGEVLVSSTVKDLVAGSGLGFEDRGDRQLEGIPGEWHLYALS